MANVDKTCVICGEDCAGQPRTKDAKGNYYHQSCYDLAQKKRAASPTDEVDTPAPPTGLDLEPEAPSMLEDWIEAPAVAAGASSGGACPMCGEAMGPSAVLCMNCGYNTQGGAAVATKVKKPKRERGEGGGVDWDSLFKNPLAVSATIFGFDVILMLILKSSPGNLPVALIWLAESFVVGLLVLVLVLVSAFREGIGTGLLTLCLPFYVLYFIYFVCESLWTRCLFTANILGYLLSMVLFGTDLDLGGGL